MWSEGKPRESHWGNEELGELVDNLNGERKMAQWVVLRKSNIIKRIIVRRENMQRRIKSKANSKTLTRRCLENWRPR